MSSLTKAAAHGISWTAVSAGTVSVVQFVQISVLARFLTADEFGLMAMVMVVLGFVQTYADMGISNAIIHRQDTNAAQLSSLYWLNWFASAALYVLLAAAAPLVVSMYHEPRLYSLVLTTGLILVISPLGLQFRILLQKTFEFRLLAIIECTSSIMGCIVAVVAATAGYGVYSLIFGQLTAATYASVHLVVAGWRRWPPMMYFRFADLAGYLRFGFFQIGERSINYLGARSDQLIIGILLGSTPLGYYVLAWNTAIQPLLKLNPIFTRVAFPLFSKVQDDVARLRRGYIMQLWLIAVINAPLLLGLAAVSTTLVLVVFGAKWAPIAEVLQILAVAGLLKTLGNPVGSLLLAKGRADTGFYWNAVVFAIQIPTFYLGIRFGGICGAACAVLVLQALMMWPMYVFLVRPFIGAHAKEYWRDAQGGPAVCGVVMAIVVLCVQQADIRPTLLLLVVQIGIGAAVYVALCWGSQRRRIWEMIQIVFGSTGVRRANA